MERRRRRALLIPAVLVAGLASVCAGKRSPDMSLALEFTVAKTDLVFGESPICDLVVRNDGLKPIDVVHPEEEGSVPVFRLIQAGSGQEKLFRGLVEPRDAPIPESLDPGATMEAQFRLLDRIPVPIPGVYTLSVIYEDSTGKVRVESDPIKLQVRMLTVRGLHLPDTAGASLTGVCANVASDPPDLVLADLLIGPDGGLNRIELAGTIPPDGSPRVSVPANLASSLGSWIAWFEEKNLRFVHFDPRDGATSAGKLALGSIDSSIVPPLHIEPGTNYGDRKEGTVVVWSNEGKGSILQLVRLEPAGKKAKATPDARFVIPAPRPPWAWSHMRSKGNPFIVFVREEKGKLVLYGTPWPTPQLSSMPERKLLEWEGERVVATSTLGFDDFIHGAVMVWATTTDGARELVIHPWTVEPQGKTEAGEPIRIPWGPTTAIADVHMRVSESGTPAVLLRTTDQDWQLFRAPDQMRPVAIPYGSRDRRPRITFLDDDEVVLVCPDPVYGLVVKKPDGSDLPEEPR
jgi:hypothetical protein